MKRRRADEVLMETFNLESIALARALIMEGRVMSGDRKILAISELLKETEQLRVKGEIDHFVSRGAHKLKRALEVFSIELKDKTCVDIGCSTGGFTDIMIRNGASKVYSIDVGYNLLDYRLRSDPRVTVMEKTNARFLDKTMFDPLPEFGATDVSFISLKAILPQALALLTGERRFVALIKPQFEALPEDVGAKGVVRDPAVHEKVLREILAFIDTLDWKVSGLTHSPIRGPEGNIEFLLFLEPRIGESHHDFQNDVIDIITQAYDFFSKS